NTTNGWWPKSEGFHHYLARCSYLLQQGEFVGDVAFYYGDEAPNFVPPKHVPATLGLGYDYDVVNTDVIVNKMTVRDNRIYLPHGQFYEVLVLPQEARMNPAVLQKLEQMVAAGATIIGPKPQRSYSLSNPQTSDRQIQSLAAKLWGKVDSAQLQEQVYGKGKIVWGKTVREVLRQKGITPDVQLKTDNSSDSIDYIHRRTADADIYFIRNKKEEPITGNCTFRVKGKQPEWWIAETGNTVLIPAFTNTKDGITIPLHLAAHGSAFIIFQKPIATKPLPATASTAKDLLYTSKGLVIAKTNDVKSLALKSPWEVRFEHKGNTPVAETMQSLHSWHQSNDSAIKYFSGQATYYNSFEVSPDGLNKDAVLLLALNNVKEIADVYLNGKRLGQHWHSSHVFALKEELKPGINNLVIEVVNSINNSLIADAKNPRQYRQMRSNITKLPNAWQKPFAEAPLLEAGLIGPVTMKWASLWP
ncbi:MAG TPA: glycosyl hydrolase, partial [Chitinophagaceae bacterium]|nr:glycosyl hydrolase [Chitinophagaceae bacterium]